MGDAVSSINAAYKNDNDDVAFNFLVEAMLMGPESFLNAYRQTGLLKALESKDEEKIEKAVETLKEKAGRILQRFRY